MKREAKIVDGTPDKRLFWSIISDYNLKTAISELVDNALDTWLKAQQSFKLRLDIDLDTTRQLLKITDNAGGVASADHQLLISPGGSKNNPMENTIGIFGVGTKRAVVALAEEIKIITRDGNEKTYEIDIDSNWLASESWNLPVYEVPDIAPGTTVVDMSRLRIHLMKFDVNLLIEHLSETYAQFMAPGKCQICVNGEQLTPRFFDKWAYPPNYVPRYYLFNLKTEDDKSMGVEIYAGLMREKPSPKDAYGVYFYCNNRLIAKNIKDTEVGYVSGVAGVPHPDASLCRVIIKLHGAASLMPWNSSKSAIIYSHNIFKGLQEFLMPIVTHYSSLSRRFRNQWEEQVFSHTTGDTEAHDVNDIKDVKKSHLPPLPKVRKSGVDVLKTRNKALLSSKPWTLGIIEAIAAVDVINKQKLETKNRINLLLLDSTFEIALKEYIVHTDGLNLRGRTFQQIFDNREEVISIVRQKIQIDDTDFTKIKHFASMRNKLIHERATVDVAESDIANYLTLVERMLQKLFDYQEQDP